MISVNDQIIDQYKLHLTSANFPCVGARASIQKNQARYMVADHMACSRDDAGILTFLYDFVDEYRQSTDCFYSASIIFQQPEMMSEEEFDTFLWKRLQSLSDLDSSNYCYDPRVSADPQSPDFCFSLKGEAFFIIGMHASSNRLSRQFKYPVLVFNPHAQFEKLKMTDAYKKLQHIIRERDTSYSGSVNPMLSDFSGGLEVNQYSGRIYENSWQCPLKINHAKT